MLAGQTVIIQLFLNSINSEIFSRIKKVIQFLHQLASTFFLTYQQRAIFSVLIKFPNLIKMLISQCWKEPFCSIKVVHVNVTIFTKIANHYSGLKNNQVFISNYYLPCSIFVDKKHHSFSFRLSTQLINYFIEFFLIC